MLNNLSINKYGILGIVLILLMLSIRMLSIPLLQDLDMTPFLYRLLVTVADPYILFSIIPYVIFNLLINSRLSPQSFTKYKTSSRARYNLQTIFIGMQIAFILLIVGLFLGLQNIVWQIVYYMVAVAIGLVMPFFLFSRRGDQTQEEKRKDLDL